MAEYRFTDARSFTAALNGAALKLPAAAISQIQRSVMLKALQRVVSGSPVAFKGGGRFRGNTQVSTGAPTASAVARIDPSGGATLAEGTRRILAFLPYSLNFISNSLRYSEVLEYGLYPPSSRGKGQVTSAGFSRQAPRGVYRIAFESMKLDLQAEIARVAAIGQAPGALT